MSKLVLRISALVAIGLSGLATADAAIVQTVRTSSTFTTMGGAQVEAIAWCQAGEVVSGGGHNMTYGDGLFIYYNGPVTSGSLQGWKFRFWLASVPIPPGSSVGTAFAVCLKQQ
ncbi:hypothetical protein J5226_12560 [Lysobacter sp. K5869]|uniref:hypothetical protein n=1 Tax=Lysobacter sp. K5869 TaxID=2820808 RepID=UPI001C061247|nr:hypothetical protein [Lysobacter sp. K5869]QWP79162.1 hypothetical protein J5226_12560 [Lysobacter sp. K5869]